MRCGWLQRSGPVKPSSSVTLMTSPQGCHESVQCWPALPRSMCVWNAAVSVGIYYEWYELQMEASHQHLFSCLWQIVRTSTRYQAVYACGIFGGGPQGKEHLTGAHSSLQQVNGGSKAEYAELQLGDVILEINGENTSDMLNVEAQNKIKNSKTQLQLVVERYAAMQIFLLKRQCQATLCSIAPPNEYLTLP